MQLTTMLERVLVIGSQGQLGRSMQAVASEFPTLEFVFADRSRLDLAVLDRIPDYLREISPRFIVNCAAYTAVDRAETEGDQADLINHQAVDVLARCAAELGACLVHVSTDYVFDGCHFRPYSEDHPTAPVNAYGQSKLRGEQAVRESGATSLILRTSWVYSEYGSNFVKTMLRLGSERPELRVVDDQIGTPTYAPDLARMICSLVQQQAEGQELSERCTLLHFSNEGVCSWFDFATQIMQSGGLTCEIKPIPSRNYPTPANRPHYSVLSKERVRELSGRTIPHWKVSLEACLRNLKGSH